MSKEMFGRGSVLIQKACSDNGLPKPQWKSDNGVTLTFFAPEATPQVRTKPGVHEGVNTPQVTPQVAPQVTPQVKKLLRNLTTEMTREELQERMQLKDRKSFSEVHLKPALEAGLIEMTIPDKPNSRLQKYRLTAKGIAAIEGE